MMNPILDDMPSFAIRDPAVIFHENLYAIFYTRVDLRSENLSLSIQMRTTADFRTFSAERDVFTGPQHYSSPGNIFRHPKSGRWAICFQSYPFGPGQRWGDDRSRLFLSESDDLVTWDRPQVLVEQGAQLDYTDSPRQIDPYVVLDGPRAWCFYKSQGQLNVLLSEDGLSTWTEACPQRPVIGCQQMPEGEPVENPCIFRHDGQWWAFCSPCTDPRRQAFGRSENLLDWPKMTYVEFPELPWATHGPTAPAILDQRDSPLGAWLMLFHGDCDPVVTGHEAVLGMAVSDDLLHWNFK